MSPHARHVIHEMSFNVAIFLGALGGGLVTRHWVIGLAVIMLGAALMGVRLSARWLAWVYPLSLRSPS